MNALNGCFDQLLDPHHNAVADSSTFAHTTTEDETF